jgi:hypothetical protein
MFKVLQQSLRLAHGADPSSRFCLSSFAGCRHCIVVACLVVLVVVVLIAVVIVILVGDLLFGRLVGWDSFSDNGRLFLSRRRKIFKFGFRRCDDETLVDRRTPLSLFARLLALLAILACAVVHQVVTSPTAIQVGTLRQAESVDPVMSHDVLATRAEGDAQLAHAQVKKQKEASRPVLSSC